MTNHASEDAGTVPPMTGVEPTSPARTAVDVLMRTVADGEGNVTLPIDVRAIMNRLGFTVECRELPDGVLGLMVRDDGDGTPVMVADHTKGRKRARLTLAALLGRWLLEADDNPGRFGVVVRDGIVTPNDAWAERFAHALLMPAGVVSAMWASPRNTVFKLAKTFDVPKWVMFARVGELGQYEDASYYCDDWR